MISRRRWIVNSSLVLSTPMVLAEEEPKIKISLNPESPAKSFGTLSAESDLTFPVGLGRNGVTPAGRSFRGGSSLLGKFRISGILSAQRFEMSERLIKQSGKTKAWLRENLFRNMSSIDFDGDGQGKEYGNAFIGLEPIESSVPQPFHFGSYKGVFRWYSYAIHGTQNPSRIGRCITGGCINVAEADLTKIVAAVDLNDLVTIS